jgi:hypothetical protein
LAAPVCHDISAGVEGAAGVEHQAVAIVHIDVARVAELGLFARPFAGQARLRIGGRLMSRSV